MSSSLATPLLIIDVAVLDANISDMAEVTSVRGLGLRPHAKTHKSPDIARRQMKAGATGLTVATVSEAEVFAEHGFDDLFIAYPLWVDGAKATRISRLLEQVQLTIGVDSAGAVEALGRRAGMGCGSRVSSLSRDTATPLTTSRRPPGRRRGHSRWRRPRWASTVSRRRR